jgi:hypothetical protein
MRRSKDIHLVNISFIDMLAGALGAVMLLFVLVPKVSFSDLERLKALDSLNIDKYNLDSLLVSLKSVVPEKDYQNLINSSATLQASIESLNAEVASIQNALNVKNQQYNNISRKYDEATKTIRDLSQQIKSAPTQEQYNKMAAELNAAKLRLSNPPPPPPLTRQPLVVAPPKPPIQGAQPDATPGKGDAIFGIDPPLTIMINWENKDDKVHLYMREAGTNGWVFYQTKRRRASFGTWDNSIKKLTNKPFEAIIQKDELVPGTYEIYAQPAKAASGEVEVFGFIAMKIGEKPIKKFNLPATKIAVSKAPYSGDANQTMLGTLTVTADDIIWNPKK